MMLPITPRVLLERRVVAQSGPGSDIQTTVLETRYLTNRLEISTYFRLSRPFPKNRREPPFLGKYA